MTVQDEVHEHSHAPHIALYAVVRVFLENQLRGHVKQRANVRACLLQILVLRSLLSESEVSQLGVAFGNEHVLGLDIPMDDIMIIEERNSGNDAPDHLQSFYPFEGSLLVNVVGQVSPIAVLHEQVDIIRGLTEVVELDDVGVRCFLAYRYLIFCALHNIFDGLLLVDAVRVRYLNKSTSTFSMIYFLDSTLHASFVPGSSRV